MNVFHKYPKYTIDLYFATSRCDLGSHCDLYPGTAVGDIGDHLLQEKIKVSPTDIFTVVVVVVRSVRPSGTTVLRKYSVDK